MAELVDALDSKSGYRKVVQVRFLFWAQAKSPAHGAGFFYGHDRSLLQGVDREKSQTCEASGTFCLGTPPLRKSAQRSGADNPVLGNPYKLQTSIKIKL